MCVRQWQCECCWMRNKKRECSRNKWGRVWETVDKPSVYWVGNVCLHMLWWEYKRVWGTVQHMKNHPVCLRVRENVSLWPGSLPILVEEKTGEGLLWLPGVGVGLEWVFLYSGLTISLFELFFTPHMFYFCLGNGLYCSAIWMQQVLLVAECQSVHIVGVRKSYHSAPFSLHRDFPESCVVPTWARCCLGLLCCPLSSLPSFPGPHQTRAAHFPPQL